MKTYGVTVKFGVVALIALATTLSGCKEDAATVKHGDAQRASQQEQEKQNRNLIDQVVNAAEHQEKYPDPAFLRGALSRLSPWLAGREESIDFEQDAEYEQIGDDCQTLASSAQRANELVQRFLADPPTATDDDCSELQQTIARVKEQLAPLAAQLRSDALNRFVMFCDEFAGKLAGAREFPLADETQTLQPQMNQRPPDHITHN